MTSPDRVSLRPTGVADLDRVLAMEADADTRGWLGESSRGWHASALDDPDREHLLVVCGDALVGFVLLAAPRGTEDGTELRRIVIAREHRRRGLGRAALRAVTERVFLGAAFPGTSGRVRPPGRLWLDVKPDNHRALALYETEGFVRERELAHAPGTPAGRVALVILARHRDRAGPDPRPALIPRRP